MFYGLPFDFAFGWMLQSKISRDRLPSVLLSLITVKSFVTYVIYFWMALHKFAELHSKVVGHTLEHKFNRARSELTVHNKLLAAYAPEFVIAYHRVRVSQAEHPRARRNFRDASPRALN